jgi:type I restriction enzyme S subunit
MVKFETTPFCLPDELLQGLTYRPENVKDHGLLVVRSSNVQNGRLVFNDNVYVDCEVDADHLIHKGDIIICVRNGSSALIGKCAIADRDYKATWGAFMACVRSPRNEYLYQVFQSGIVQEQIHGKSNATINQITNRDFRELIIPLPSLPEQCRIAATLSDMDGYIAALEKLITKKRDIKKGAMQELLTGKRRLPGFSGEWTEKPLRRVLKVGHGKSQNEIEVAGGKYPILATGGEIGRTDTFLYDQPSVLIGRKGTIDKPQYMDTPFWTIDTLFYTVINDNVYPKYLYYLFCTVDWASLNEASGVPSLSASIIERLQFVLPKKAEQSAIATILSDMDTEIDALTARMNKARNIKQGMMQELLTGRIRLVAEETEAAPVAKPTAKVIELSKHEPQTAAAQASGHNKAIEDAVILAVVADLYATERFPLTPFYAQKFPYLLHRYIEGVAQGYHKLAAGPYNAELKYRTALPIAKKNRYVVTQKSQYKGKSYEAMLAGDNIEQAKDYFAQWHGNEPLKWLEQFRYIKNRREELELLATVDMAMMELREVGAPISVQAVKAIIQASEEWKEKLKREIFSDDNIARAIKWSNYLFGTEVKMP